MRLNRFLYNVLPVLLLAGLVSAALLLGGCSDDETLAPLSLDPVELADSFPPPRARQPAVRANENAGCKALPAFSVQAESSAWYKPLTRAHLGYVVERV